MRGKWAEEVEEAKKREKKGVNRREEEGNDEAEEAEQRNEGGKKRNKLHVATSWGGCCASSLERGTHKNIHTYNMHVYKHTHTERKGRRLTRAVSCW